jgi:hypothetical protein
MSESPTDEGPCAAYSEEFHEESGTTIPGTRQSANVTAKRSLKRDEASDSGYSSRTAATGGSLSQESTTGSVQRNGLFKTVKSRVAGATKKSPKDSLVQATKRTASRNTNREKDSKADTPIESKEEAARMKLSGTMDSNKEIVHRHPKPSSPELTRTTSARAIPIPQSNNRGVVDRVGSLTKDSSSSYHGIAYPYGQSTQVFHHHPPYPSPVMPSAFHNAPHFPPHIATYVSTPTPLPSSPNRQVSYPFPPTIPPGPMYHHPPGSWTPEYFAQPAQAHHGPPALPRRYSVQGQAPIVDYPSVHPQYRALQKQSEYARRPSFSNFDQRSVFGPIEDEAVFIDDQESFYRPASRRAEMPPPPVPARPAIRHALTSGTVHQRPNRNSLEYAAHSPHKPSFEEPRPPSRPSLSSRNSSARNVPPRVTAPPASPGTVRRRRPESYHSATNENREKQAEEYQAAQKGPNQPHPLTADAIKQVNKAEVSKTKKSKGSDVGSRASSSRDSNDVKKRMSMEKRRTASAQETINIHLPPGNNMRIKYDDGAMTMSFGNVEDLKQREGRQPERPLLRDERRYSVSGRRDIKRIMEHGEREPSRRRPSSSLPLARRKESDDSDDEEIISQLQNLRVRGARFVQEQEDEEEEEDSEESSSEDSEELAKREDDKLLMRRLQKLRASSQSQRNTRSGSSLGGRKALPAPIGGNRY